MRVGAVHEAAVDPLEGAVEVDPCLVWDWRTPGELSVRVGHELADDYQVLRFGDQVRNGSEPRAWSTSR